MQLTSENYYSQEANQEYMSVSGYKDFAGTYGKMPCEFYGMEKLKTNRRGKSVEALREIFETTGSEHQQGV